MQCTPRHFVPAPFAVVFVTVLTFLLSISCASQRAATPTSNNNSSSTKPVPTPPPASNVIPLAIPALWESVQRSGSDWSQRTAQIINSNCAAMIEGPKDMASFCPKYNALSHNQKINVWVYLISAITKYESGFKPTARMVESTMGTDPITGKQVVSEGLLQLSYQDQIGYSFCKVFDWSTDKHLASTDPNKTILNPYLNLECGVQILNRQIERYNQIAINSGAYWSTLKPSGSKVSLIKALVKGMGICQ